MPVRLMPLSAICEVQMNRLTMTQRNIFSRLSIKVLPIIGALVGAIATLFMAAPAMAHHPFGGQAPKNIFEGLVSGIGHPVLGLDHFAFVVTVGLLAAVLRRGVTVPLAFLLAALTGTGLHLSAVTLPALEWVVSGSVLLFGLLLVTRNELNTRAVVALTALIGLFHGYAYGEAVIGAEPTPLVAYLLGFTLVQGAIALTAYVLAQRILAQDLTESRIGIIPLRQAGFFFCGAGAVFLSNLLA
jgi:urease accessory protein